MTKMRVGGDLLNGRFKIMQSIVAPDVAPSSSVDEHTLLGKLIELLDCDFQSYIQANWEEVEK